MIYLSFEKPFVLRHYNLLLSYCKVSLLFAFFKNYCYGKKIQCQKTEVN